MATAAALETFLKENPSFYTADAAGTSVKAIEDHVGAALPADYKWLLETIGCGGSAEGPGLNIDPPEIALGMTNETSTAVDGLFVIGNDSTGNLVVLDPTNKLGKGAWSVFFVGMDEAFSRDHCWFGGQSIPEVMQRIAKGEFIVDGASLGDD